MSSHRKILDTLKESGGFITDSSGSAGKVLMEKAGVGYSGGMNALKDLVERGVIERITGMGGRRTYRISLTGVELPPSAVVEARASAPRSPRKPRRDPPSADEVAEALLKLALQTVEAKADVDVEHRIAEAMKGRLSDAEATIVALRDELSKLQAKMRRRDEERRDVDQENNRLKKANAKLASQLQEKEHEINRMKIGITRDMGKLEDRLDPSSKAVLDTVRSGGK